YTIYHGNDSTIVYLDQTDFNKTGWQKLTTVYLEEGEQTVVKLDNSNVTGSEWIIADATMLMINRKLTPDLFVSPDMVGIKEEEKQPIDFTLNQNYPNPFNASTNISYTLPQTGFITLKIYDIMGREIKNLENHQKSAGHYTINFNAKDLSSGLYFYQMKYTNQQTTSVKTKKLMVVK
ncbi:MAG: T9SS type A sorting domain-containing protein, partial [Fidelibacterota bacterium]